MKHSMDDSVKQALSKLEIQEHPENSEKLLISAVVDKKPPKWATQDNNFWQASQIVDTLPPGLYRAGMTQSGPILSKIECDTDQLLELPDSASAEVLKEIKRFWELEDEFNKRGFLHKRGVLMAGPPGGGKTATAQLIIKKIINQGGIAIYIDEPTCAAACLQMVRRIEKKRPIVALLEDFDALLDRYKESEYLSLLDGESQINNIVFVATSNYPEKLQKRFTDRPSRFDLVIEVGMPNANSRRMFLKHKETSLTTAELNEWVRQTDEFSLAHLRELIILVKCYGMEFTKALARIKRLSEEPMNSSTMGKQRAGFGFTRSSTVFESNLNDDSSSDDDEEVTQVG